jgi:hypothetical protein
VRGRKAGGAEGPPLRETATAGPKGGGGLQSMYENSKGFVDIVRIWDAMERGERWIAIPPRKWATFFAGVTRAGESIALQSQRRLTRRPYAEKFKCRRAWQQSQLKKRNLSG